MTPQERLACCKVRVTFETAGTRERVLVPCGPVRRTAVRTRLRGPRFRADFDADTELLGGVGEPSDEPPERPEVVQFGVRPNRPVSRARRLSRRRTPSKRPRRTVVRSGLDKARPVHGRVVGSGVGTASRSASNCTDLPEVSTEVRRSVAWSRGTVRTGRDLRTGTARRSKPYRRRCCSRRYPERRIRPPVVVPVENCR